MSEVIDRVSGLLRARIDEIDRECGRLERALGGLGADGTGTKRRTATASSGTVRRARRGARRAPRGRRREQLLAQIKAKPGAPIAELARGMGVAPQQLYPIVHRLKQGGEIHKRDRGFATGPGSAKSA